MQVAEERIANIRLLKSFSQESRECDTYNKKLHHVLQLAYKESLARGIFFGLVGIASWSLSAISLIRPFGYTCCYKYRYYPSEQWINFLRLLVFLSPVPGLLRGEKKVRRNCMYILIYVIGISQKNSKVRTCRFYADDAPYVHLSNRLSVLEGDQQNTGFFKHVENKVKPLVGQTKSQKRKILLLGSSYPRTPG